MPERKFFNLVWMDFFPQQIKASSLKGVAEAEAVGERVLLFDCRKGERNSERSAWGRGPKMEPEKTKKASIFGDATRFGRNSACVTCSKRVTQNLLERNLT